MKCTVYHPTVHSDLYYFSSYMYELVQNPTSIKVKKERKKLVTCDLGSAVSSLPPITYVQYMLYDHLLVFYFAAVCQFK